MLQVGFVKSKFIIIALSIITVSSVLGGWWVHRVQVYAAKTNVIHSNVASGEYLVRSFSEAGELVNRYYVNEIESDTLTKGSIQGMLRSLDPHSSYFDTKEFQELQSEQHSQFYGIGVTINRRNNRVYVLGTIDNTPADKAGLRYGDAIVAVNGKSAIDWTTAQVMDQVRGPQGEFVEVTVERAGVPKPLTFNIIRGAVPLPSIRHFFMIKPTVGYIALIGGFNHTTEDELKQALQILQAQGLKSLILDLRNNPGGLLTQAVKVAGTFLPKNIKVLSQKGRDGSIVDTSLQEYKSDNPNPNESAVVVLINGGTASASEIVAGAIQDHDRGLVVGEHSFGKGLVQTVFRLPFGSGLTLTTAKYYTPSGRCIQRDYSNISFYDYYTRHKESMLPIGPALTTDIGRKVYSGGGITPDIEVKESSFTAAQGRLFNAAFEFTRRLTGGQIQGFPQFKITHTRYHHALRDDEFVVNEKVINAFREFISENKEYKVGDPQVNENLLYLKNLIREQVVTAAYGTEAGMEVHLQADVQTLKALDSIQAAQDLANNTRLFRPSER